MPAYELNLQDYGRVIRQRKWVILLVFLGVFGSTLIYLHFYQRPVYEVSAIVRITQQKGVVIGISSVGSIAVSPGRLMPTQVQIVTSWPVVEKVVRELGLAGPEPAPEKVIQTVAHLRKKVISASVIGQTDAIKIKVAYPDAEMAVQIANTVAEVYIQLNLTEKKQGAQNTKAFIGRRLEDVDKKLREAEERLKQFMESHQITGKAVELYDQLADLEEQRETLAYPNQLANLEKARDECLRKCYDRLVKMEKQRDALLLKYTEKYPEVVRLTEAIALQKEEIARYPDIEKDPDIIWLNHQIAALKARMAQDPEMKQDPELIRLDQQITTLKENLNQYSENEIELSRLTRDVRIKTTLYADLKQKFTSAEIEAEQIPDVTLVERAKIPTKPVKPDKPRVFIISGLIALILGLSAAFIVEHLDRSIVTIEEVENVTNLPILGVIPYFKGQAQRLKWWSWLFIPIRLRKSPLVELERFRQGLLFWYPPTSSIGETYAVLRANILAEGTETPSPEGPAPKAFGEPPASPYRALSKQFRPEEEKTTLPPEPNQPVKKNLMITVTSSTHREGKSLTAVNLALSLAQGGHTTLLVDADIRKPIIHKLFNLRRAGGLNDILKGTGTLTDIISGQDLRAQLEDMAETPYLDRLSILTAGRRERYPSELVRSPAFKALLEEVRKRYEVVVVDCPPILGLADMLTLGPYADVVLMVYRTGRTLRQLLVRAKQQLETTGIKVKGIVLNCIKPAYDVYYAYYHYYAYTEPKPEPEPEPEAEPKPQVKPKPEAKPKAEAKPKFRPEEWRFYPEQKVWKHRHKPLFKRVQYFVVDGDGRCSQCGKHISKYIPKYYRQKWEKGAE